MGEDVAAGLAGGAQAQLPPLAPFEGVVSVQPDLVCDFWTEVGRNMAARMQPRPTPRR